MFKTLEQFCESLYISAKEGAMDLFSAHGAEEALTDYTCRVFHQNEGCPWVAAVAEADELSQICVQ